MTKLGQEVRDKITGFAGIALYEIDFMFGCAQYGVAAKMKEDGTIKDAEFFDEGRLEKVGDGVDPTGNIPEWHPVPKLGNKVRDKITGFEGIIVGRVRLLYGGVKFVVTPSVGESGEMRDGQWFDADRVEVIGNGITPEEVQAEKKGGISRDIPKGLR